MTPSRALATARLPGLAAGLLLGLAASADAARSLVDTIPLSTRARYVTGVGDDWIAATSGSSGNVVVVDLRDFDELADPLSLGSSFFARSMNASRDAIPKLLVGDHRGYVNVFYSDEIQDQADGGDLAFNYSFRFEATGEDPITAVAADPLGSSIYAGNATDETVGRFALDGSAIGVPAFLDHAPFGGTYVPLVADRVYFATTNGMLASVDAGSLGVRLTNVDGGALTNDLVVHAAVFAGGATRVLVLDKDTDSLLVFDPSNDALVDSIGLAGNPVALAVSGPPGSAVIWVAEDGPNQLEAFTESLAQAQPPLSLPGAPLAMAEVDGRLFVGVGSSLAVVTDRPWIEITDLNPDVIAGPGQPVQVTFSSNTAGSVRVTVNGTQVATGTAAASPTNTITLPAEAVHEELTETAPNRVRVEVTASTGLVGHDEGVLIYDVPPGAPVNFRVGFGDGRVIGTWDRNPDTTELKAYRVFFGLDEFLDGTGSLTSPQEVGAGTERYIVQVSNGTEVFMAVAAVDSAGNLSAMTPILSAIARPTSNASDRAGDDGGFLISCTVAPAGRAAGALMLGVFPLALALALALAVRRLR